MRTRVLLRSAAAALACALLLGEAARAAGVKAVPLLRPAAPPGAVSLPVSAAPRLLATPSLALPAAAPASILPIAPSVSVLPAAPAASALPVPKVRAAAARTVAPAPGRGVRASVSPRWRKAAAAVTRHSAALDLPGARSFDGNILAGRRGRGVSRKRHSAGRPKSARKRTSRPRVPRGDGRTDLSEDGVPLWDRALRYHDHVLEQIRDLRSRRADISESLDVMQDAYEESLAKILAIEALFGRDARLDGANFHVPNTLVWVDAILKGRGGRRTAVHTHRVYYHAARDKSSEVAEGLRRAEGAFRNFVSLMAAGGRAEAQVGRLDEVVLLLDTRGHAAIRSRMEELAREASEKHTGRFRFLFLEDLAEMPRDRDGAREALREAALRHRRDRLGQIHQGIVYRRYTGLALELTTIQHYLQRGYTLLQSGREFFDENGQYVTELDLVVRSPQGKVLLVEAKSARVRLPPGAALKGKVTYKLEVYRKHRALLERAIGAPIDGVVFSMDYGKQAKLASYLKRKAPSLSSEYGFPVEFLFLESGPKDGRRSARGRPRGGKKRR